MYESFFYVRIAFFDMRIAFFYVRTDADECPNRSIPNDLLEPLNLLEPLHLNPQFQTLIPSPPPIPQAERIFVELMTLKRKLKAFREGSECRIYAREPERSRART